MNKSLFNKVCIVGVGLIGGSLGMAIKKRKLAKLVVGVVRRKETAIESIEKKAVDVAVFDLKEGVRDADLVILSAPVTTIIQQLSAIKPHLKKQALIIDVGSSKQKIESVAAKILKKNTFVGCHPMAGSARTGVTSADADIFDGAQCFVTRPNALVNRFWKALGSTPIFMDPKKHDAWVARVSYLPHLAAFSLFQQKTFGKFLGDGMRALNPSLREFARLSRSDAALWSDILVSNEDSLHSLAEFEKNVHQLRQILRRRKVDALKNFIRESNRISAKLVPDNSK